MIYFEETTFSYHAMNKWLYRGNNDNIEDNINKAQLRFTNNNHKYLCTNSHTFVLKKTNKYEYILKTVLLNNMKIINKE